VRVLILCGGPSSPFDGPGSSPKHLIQVEGEQILRRTVRLVRQYTPDVHVIRPKGDARYEMAGAQAHDEFLKHPMETVKHMFWPSRHVWAPNERTILLLGDVWFSEDAIRTIMQERREWCVFGRAGASTVTGCEYGEIWAFAFDCTFQDRLDLGIVSIAKTRSWYGGGVLTGWEVHDALGARPFVEIDDYTEDFDSPEDFRKWKESRDAHINGDISSTRAPLGMSEL
jgi:choline kinase